MFFRRRMAIGQVAHAATTADLLESRRFRESAQRLATWRHGTLDSFARQWEGAIVTNATILMATQLAGGSNAPLDESINGLVDLAKLGVIFLGGYFGHWLLLRRDRRLRQRAFIYLITQLKHVVLQGSSGGDFVMNYRDSIRNIARAAAPVVGDFSEPRGVALQRMIIDLCRNSPAEAQSNQNQILDEIGAITQFVTPEVLPASPFGRNIIHNYENMFIYLVTLIHLPPWYALARRDAQEIIPDTKKEL